MSKTPLIKISKKYRSHLNPIFHQAVGDSSHRDAATLISIGADVNAVNEEPRNMTPLMTAAYKKDKLMIEQLLAAGANINAVDASGWSPLKYAVENKDHEIIDILLTKKADLNSARTDDGYPNRNRTILMSAAAQPDNTIVKKLIAAGAEVEPTGRDTEGATPLIIASFCGHDNNVRTLLENGADIHAQNKYGGTALLHAATRGNPTVIKTLLEKGADIKDTDKNGENALVHAVACVHNGHDSREFAINALLEIPGIDLNAKHHYEGETALMYAIRYHSYDNIIDKLLAAGADVNAKDNDGYTALIRRADKRYSVSDREVDRERIEKLLAIETIDVNAQNNKGQTALMVAASRDHQWVVDRLLAIPGIDVSITDNEGRTASMLAAQKQHIGLATQLQGVAAPVMK